MFVGRYVPKTNHRFILLVYSHQVMDNLIDFCSRGEPRLTIVYTYFLFHFQVIQTIDEGALSNEFQNNSKDGIHLIPTAVHPSFPFIQTLSLQKEQVMTLQWRIHTFWGAKSHLSTLYQGSPIYKIDIFFILNVKHENYSKFCT